TTSCALRNPSEAMRTTYGVCSTTPSYQVQSAHFKYIVPRMNLLSAIGVEQGRTKKERFSGWKTTRCKEPAGFNRSRMSQSRITVVQRRREGAPGGVAWLEFLSSTV